MTLSVQQLAWAAGVIDVKGALRLRPIPQSAAVLPMIAISTTNLPMLQVLADITGMSITPVARDFVKNGCTVHCPERHVHVRSNTGRWSVTGVRATVVLYNVLPYMQLQNEVAGQLLEGGLRSPHKPATIAKMVALGWTAPEFHSPKGLSE